MKNEEEFKCDVYYFILDMIIILVVDMISN